MKTYIRRLLLFLGLYSLAKQVYGPILHLASFPKWRALRGRREVWLELGSGPKKGAGGWVTVDMAGADIAHDLRRGIPMPSGSVDRLYTSHMFEHIPYNELVGFINECFRVLKKNGELSVCVPDASLYIRAYARGERFRRIEEGYKPALVDTGSLMDQVNFIAYMGQHHQYMFDSENLINTLKKAAFSEVTLRKFGHELDLPSRDFESIYATAIK